MTVPVSRHRIVTLSLAAAAVLFGGLARAEGWPRDVETPNGKVVLSRPSAERLDGDRLTLRVPFEVRREGKRGLAGDARVEARILTDRDAGTVTLRAATVRSLELPGAGPDAKTRLSHKIETSLAAGDATLTYDDLLAALSVPEGLESKGLATAPPRIVYSAEPAVLVSYDGDPQLVALEGSGLMRVVNTPFPVLYDTGAKTYWTTPGFGLWYRAPEATGPFAPGDAPRAVLDAAASARREAEDTDAATDDAQKPATAPRILTTTAPAELLAVDGPPRFTPIEGTGLMAVSNTDADLFLEPSSGTYYVVLAGRWFTAKILEGPWTPVASDRLPAGFSRIPKNSEAADVLAFVAGTAEAKRAILEAAIPVTSEVKRAEARLEVTWDGEPKFEAISGTSLALAANASAQVLRSNGRYFACDGGVWFVSGSPSGPWVVADARPEGLDAVPPESPAYATRYVSVYDATPDVVYVGYTSGYLGGYVWGPTIVYGTGYWYRPWISPRWYWPRPWTWSVGVRWRAGRGWGYGWGFHAGGVRFAVGVGGWWGPRWHRAGWYGPAGFHAAWRPGYVNRPRVNVNVTVNRTTNVYRRTDVTRNVTRASAAPSSGPASKAGARAGAPGGASANAPAKPHEKPAGGKKAAGKAKSGKRGKS